MTHSLVGPSGAFQRIQCPWSVKAQALYPEQGDHPDAAAGDAAHWAASEQVQGRLVDVGVIAPNGVVLDADMLKAADLYSDDITRVLAPLGLRPEHGHAERPVAIPRIHPQAFGTPDYYLFHQPVRTLYLWDFKYGHRIVEHFENQQLVEYAAGICEGMSDLDPPVNIVATIVQPRAMHREGPVRRWHTTLASLRPLINTGSTAAHEALGPEPRARVGPACRDCRARHACPTLQRAGFAAMDEAERPSPLDLTPEQAAIELAFVNQALDRLKARSSGLSQQIEAVLKAGKSVPGWRLEHGSGREQWTVPAAQVLAVGQMLGLSLAKPTELITPNQAREKGLDPTLVAQFSTRPRAAATLVPDDGSTARRIFG